MGMDGQVPNLTASAAVSPYRFVKVSGNMTGAPCATQFDVAVGVSDGSVSGFNATTNAAIGDPIQLQQGRFMQVELTSASCDGGDLLSATTDGKALPEGAVDPGAQFHMVAAQDGTSGAIVWAFWRPTVITTDIGITVDGTYFSGNGTTGDPLTLEAVITDGVTITGTGTTGDPLSAS